MRLARLALNFGAEESNSSDAQILNVGGSVSRLDLMGWLKLSPADKTPSRCRIIYARQDSAWRNSTISAWRSGTCRWIWW